MMPVVIKESTEMWNLEGAIEKYFKDGFSDGDIVSHDWLAYALELPKPVTASEAMKAQWVTLDRVEQFKRALLIDHRIALSNVRGQGYRVVPPSDQARYAVSTAMVGVRRELSKCDAVLNHTRTELLSDEERKRHTDAQVKMQAISGMANREKRDIFKLFNEKKN